MATVVYNAAKTRLGKAQLDFTTGTFKVLLLKTKGTAPNNPDNPDLATVAAVLATTGTAEFNDTGYAGGFAGAGRKTLAYTSVPGGNQAGSLQQDNANDWAWWDFDDVTWASLGGTQTVNGALLYLQPGGAASDSDCIPIVFLDVTVVTNGGDVTLQPGSSGVVHIT